MVFQIRFLERYARSSYERVILGVGPRFSSVRLIPQLSEFVFSCQPNENALWDNQLRIGAIELLKKLDGPDAPLPNTKPSSLGQDTITCNARTASQAQAYLNYVIL